MKKQFIFAKKDKLLNNKPASNTSIEETNGKSPWI